MRSPTNSRGRAAGALVAALIVAFCIFTVGPVALAQDTPTVTSTPTETSTPTVTNTPTVTPAQKPPGVKLVGTAGHKTYLAGVSVATIIRRGEGILQRIVVSNTNASAQTLTVKDGSATLQVIEIPTKATLTVEFRLAVRTTIEITPSHADVRALVVWD